MPADRDAEIVRRVRAGHEAFNRGDFDAATAMMRPDVEYVPVGGQAPIRGVKQMREWMEPSAWDLLLTRIETFLPHEEELARSTAGLGARSRGG